mgnify:FL=1
MFGGALMYQMNSAKYKFASINYKERNKIDYQLSSLEKEYNLTYRSNFEAINNRVSDYKTYGELLVDTGGIRYMGKIDLKKIKDIDLSTLDSDTLEEVNTYYKRIGRRGRLMDTNIQTFVNPIERIE